MLTFIFDASALIAAARFDVRGTPILDHILSCSHPSIPTTVKTQYRKTNPVDLGLVEIAE